MVFEVPVWKWAFLEDWSHFVSIVVIVVAINQTQVTLVRVLHRNADPQLLRGWQHLTCVWKYSIMSVEIVELLSFELLIKVSVE